ncbi:MAG: hypothetical protein M1587_02780, partial [Thaumarchaeota archaeon]|nr:hypothetical protein [Nitrososphaerota archaeon]
MAIKWFENLDKHTAIHRAVVLISLSVILIISAYGIVATVLGHINVVGETLVDVEIPPPQIFPL